MDSPPEKLSACSVAARVAGEDLVSGDFVGVLHEFVEIPSFLWDCSGGSGSPEEMVRLRVTPGDAGEPLKVYATCLPFVYAKDAGGILRTLDLRQVQLVRLQRSVAQKVWQKKRDKSSSKRSRSRQR